MSYFDEVQAEIIKGEDGKGNCIPIPFPRLNEHVNIRKGMYTLIGGTPGSGKTGFTDCAFALGAYDWHKQNKDKTDIKLEIIYRSMERPRAFKLAKWMCMHLYNKYKILIDVPTLFGWNSNHVSAEVKEKIKETREYFEEMEDVIKIIDGAENPSGVYKHLLKTALSEGKVVKKNEFEEQYIPNDPNKITLVILDHIGKLKSERNYTKKQNIDKMSELLGISRDFYGFSPVVVSQFNRSLSNPNRARGQEVTPGPDDFKDSSNMYEDCDTAFALFNPWKYQVNDHMDYNIEEFVNNKGYNRFRSITLLKNSYGVDDARVGMGFIGEVGMYKELPPAERMTPQMYVNVREAGLIA